MAKKAHARRYAQAVFSIAQEKGELDRWQSDLEAIAGLLADESVAAVLESPKVPLETKIRLLSEGLGGVDPLALNLVLLLLTRDGLSMMADVAAEFRVLVDGYHGIEQAEVTTAVPLSDEDKSELARRLGDITGKKVNVKAEVDPGIVGGIMARVGGKLLDGSTRSRLKTLQRELAQGGG